LGYQGTIEGRGWFFFGPGNNEGIIGHYPFHPKRRELKHQLDAPHHQSTRTRCQHHWVPHENSTPPAMLSYMRRPRDAGMGHGDPSTGPADAEGNRNIDRSSSPPSPPQGQGLGTTGLPHENSAPPACAPSIKTGGAAWPGWLQ
jgi:hypothetical protein